MPLAVMVTALKALPVPVVSTPAVLTEREPSPPALKSVAVTVNVPSAARGTTVEVSMAATFAPPQLLLARLTSERAPAPLTPSAGVRRVCAVTLEAAARRRRDVVKNLANMFGGDVGFKRKTSCRAKE